MIERKSLTSRFFLRPDAEMNLPSLLFKISALMRVKNIYYRRNILADVNGCAEKQSAVMERVFHLHSISTNCVQHILNLHTGRSKVVV
jgi:hypothetical protein